MTTSTTPARKWPQERVIFVVGIIVMAAVGIFVLPRVPAVTSNAQMWFFIQVVVAGAWMAWYADTRRYKQR